MRIKGATIKDYKEDIDNSNSAILIDNLSGQIELVNSRLCQLFGYDKEEILALDQFALVHEDDRETVKKYHKDRMDNKVTVPDEYLFRGVKKDGTVINVWNLSLPRFDQNKKPQGTISFIWDITRSQKLEDSLTERENELIQSEIELQGILESTADGILIVDENGNVLKTNKKFAELWKIPSDILKSGDDDQLLSYVLDQLVDPKKFLSKVQKLYNSTENDFDTLSFKDGRMFERYSRPMMIGSESIGRIWSFRDVTDKWNAEEALKHSEGKFRSLIENSPTIIMRIEKGGIISFVNFDYAGHRPDELIGQKLYDFIPKEFRETAKATIDNVFETKQTQSFENIEMNTNENTKWLRNNISPVVNNDVVESVNMMSMDITELKQLDIMRNEFVASVSHELRTPLTIVRESLSILESGITGKLNSEQFDIVKPCLNEVDRLSRIINNLLDITKMDRQNIELVWEMVNIVDLAKSVLYSFQNQAESKSLSLEFIADYNELRLYCDRDRMIQVFINLIGNAVKFTSSGFVRVILSEDDGDILCTIADSGDGIDDEDLGTVFDRFHQVSKVNRAGVSGSGLGLTISKGIVKLHGGKIWVKSKLGVGSEFYFTIPKLSTDQFVKQNIDDIISESRASHTKTSILILSIDNYADLSKKFSSESVNQIRDRIFRKVEEEITISDFIHRISDNQFILLSNITRQNMTMIIAQIKSIINEMIGQYDEKFSVDISTGVSVFPDDGESAKSLLESAQNQLDQIN